MEACRRSKPRTTSHISVDEYSPFFYEHDHFSFPVIETPPWCAGTVTSHPRPKRSKHFSQKETHQSTSSSTTATASADPVLEKSPYGTCLIIGRSGTGKSSLLKSLVTRLPTWRHLYLLNVRADEKVSYEKNHPGGPRKVSSIDWNGLEGIKPSSSVIVEDIIATNEKQQKHLRQAVNYTAHHKRCRLYLVTHTVYKTGMFSFMPLFTYVVFTNCQANNQIIRQTMSQFCVPKGEIETNLAAMKAKGSQLLSTRQAPDARAIYFYIDCAQMTFGWTTSHGGSGFTIKPLMEGLSEPSGSFSLTKEPEPSPSSRSTTTTTTTLNAMLDVLFPQNPIQRQKAQLILSLIQQSSFGRRHLNADTLQFVFTTERSSTRRRPGNQRQTKISLFDYLACALAEVSKPSATLVALHRFIVKKCNVPESLITNRELTGKTL